MGLLGANGSGKTTTIQMLLSTLESTAGSISYLGKDFFSHRSEILQEVVFASTYTSLPRNLTIQKNLDIFGALYGIKKSVLAQRVPALLEKFGLSHKKNHLVGELSAGQMTRLVLIRAFMVHPKVALLDEPTASLDPSVAREVIDFILEQRKSLGTAILFTSHNMGEVAAVCDRVLFLQSGSIIAEGTPKTLAHMAAMTKLELCINDKLAVAVQIAEQLQLQYEVRQRMLVLHLEEKDIALFLTQLALQNIIYTDIQIIRPSLEDYFLKITQDSRPTCCL